MADILNRIRTPFLRSARSYNKLFLGHYFYMALFLLATFITIFKLEFFGVVAFILMICALLVLCEDIFASALPFMLMCVFSMNCYDSFKVFIKIAWLAVPVAISVLFHFIVYYKRIQIGTSLFPLIGVSVALVLGGIGTISFADYFRPVSLCYVGGLGVGMVAAYILLKPHICAPRDYDTRARLLAIFYIAGLLACVMIFKNIYDNMDYIIEHRKLSWYTQMQAKNNLSTVMMFALPCPFFFASKNRFHILSPLIMIAAIILSQSRGGIIFGAIEFFMCCIIFAIVDKRNRYVYITITALALIGAACFSDKLLALILKKKSFKDIISSTEARYQLIPRAFEAFKRNPLFGHGLGYTGNTDIYDPKAGALTWYHMIIPQVVGSLGSIGILAYGYQLVERVRLIIKGSLQKKDRLLICTLGMSYVGVLLMSQVNPGLFCPIPYSLMAVMIFALIDGNIIKKPVK